MAELINIEGKWIDPNKVTSVVPVFGENSGEFFVHVDMNTWTATYRFEEDEAYGWTVDSAASVINEARD